MVLGNYELAILDLTSAIGVGQTSTYGPRGFVYALVGCDRLASDDFAQALESSDDLYWARVFAKQAGHNLDEVDKKVLAGVIVPPVIVGVTVTNTSCVH